MTNLPLPAGPNVSQSDEPQTLHQCQECKKIFTTKWRLKSHQKLHTGEKIFCEICGKGFSQVYLDSPPPTSPCHTLCPPTKPPHMTSFFPSNKEFFISHTHGKFEKSYRPTQVKRIFHSFHEGVRWTWFFNNFFLPSLALFVWLSVCLRSAGWTVGPTDLKFGTQIREHHIPG